MKLNQTTLALLLTLSAAGTILNPGAAQANDLAGKADGFLTKQAARHAIAGRTSVIVKTDGDLTSEQAARLKTLGADIYRHLPIIDSLALSLPSRNLDKLAGLAFVKHLSADLNVRKTDEFSTETSGASFAYSQYKLDGSGIGVAVIDSGVTQSHDLDKHISNGINLVPDQHGKLQLNQTDDLCGHGTHVAGIIAGNGQNSQGDHYFRTFYGVARNANIFPVRVLDANGQGTVSQVIGGIQWVVATGRSAGIRVINLSLGHPVGESYATDPLCQAVESAWKAGIVVVCSAGNSGRLQNTVDPTLDNEGYGSAYGSIQSPGNDPYVITVGAMKAMDLAFSPTGIETHTRAKDRIATYSSRGPSRLDFVLKPDIIAPGNKIISLEAKKDSTLVRQDAITNEVGQREYSTEGDFTKISENYFRLSGTSMAAPVVSGAAALLLQKDPTLTPDTIKARLMLSADKWAQPDGTVDPLTFGAGYLNIPAALASTAIPYQAAISPSLSVDANGNVFINMDRAIWGHAIDGSAALWGMYGITDLRAIWGHDSIAASTINLLSASRAIWGHSVDSERAIWGHSVWEDRAIWGHSVEGVDLSNIAVDGE